MKLAIALAVAVMLWCGAASAHALGVSRGEYVVSGDDVNASLVFRADELAISTTPRDVAMQLAISADGTSCQGTFEGDRPDAPDGVRVDVRYACGHPPRHLHVHAGFLERLPSGHAHVATLVDARGGRSEHLVVLAQPDIDLDLAAPASPGFVEFVHAGIEHILTGADHLLFLLGLVLLPRETETSRRERIRALVFVLTAFTIGHSVSLAIATLSGHAPSSRVVEPMVALSVAYVGAENLFARAQRIRRRAFITLPFGLIHGFAFASGLLLVHLPRRDLPLALLGFNVGVELGQLGVMALVLPLLFLLARRERLYDRVRAALSIGVLACGLVWFVQRLL
ncbi:MAG TPA: HupE/UreJ family protein [Polyangiaceae bacterium]